jgi:hypothetical protein
VHNTFIIGIHGLLNKPPYEVLQAWWTDAIAEGLYRNHNMSVRPPFEFAYWADIRNSRPISVEALEERYEKAAGQGPLARYNAGVADRARTVAQKWGGRVLDKEKELFGLGTNVEELLGVKFDDLADYYDKEEIRQQMRSRLSELLERHQDKKIMLIAHSMGSIIAYDVLRAYGDSETLKIEHFITIGSPLGLPIVAHKICKEFGVKQTPDNVQRWTNIADPGDRVALDCNLADEYQPNNGVQVADVLVYNKYVNHAGKANNHKSYGYLRAPEFSEYVRDFLISES